MDANKHGRSAATSRELYLTCSTITTPCPQVLGYTMGKTLGSGKFAKVKAAWSPFERQMIAIKIVDKRKVDQEDLNKFLPREISILQKVSHPNIISLFQIVETEYHCFIALELAENGDLLDYLNSRQRIPEEESRHIFHQMCQAVAYCHSLGIAHRDVKLKNIFFNKDMEVKLGDFGFALEPKNNLCSTPCGSFCYGAPEIVLSTAPEYDPQLADSWSMGVVLYAMVMGSLPFGDDNQVKNGLSNYHFLPLEGNNTKEFKTLVQSLLTVDTAAQPLIAEVTTHTWMTALPSTRPSWEGPRGGKHTIQNCLPRFFHTLNPLDYGTSKVETPYPQFAPEDQPQEIQEADDSTVTDVAQTAEFTPPSSMQQDSHALGHLPTNPGHTYSFPAGHLTSCGGKPLVTSTLSPSVASNNSSAGKITSGAKLSVVASNLPVSASHPFVSARKPLVCSRNWLISASSPDVSARPSRAFYRSACTSVSPICAGNFFISAACPVISDENPALSAKPYGSTSKISGTIHAPLSRKSFISAGNALSVTTGSQQLFSASCPSTKDSKLPISKPISASCPDISVKPIFASKLSNCTGSLTIAASNFFVSATCPAICDNSATNFQPCGSAGNTSGTINLPTSSNHQSVNFKSAVRASSISITPSTSPISDCPPISSSSLPTTSAPTVATAERRQARKHGIVSAIRSAGRRLRCFIRRRVQQTRGAV